MPQPADQGVPTLELHDVSKAFGPVVALRSGNVVLHPGSIHALVGENGAGKSTWSRSSRVSIIATRGPSNWKANPSLGDPFKFNKENIDQFDF